jgi:uncharacterized protein
MSFRDRVLCFALFLTLFFAAASFAVVPPLPRVPPNYVVDLAGIIEDGVEQRLNGHLRELEQKTTAQVVVLTIRSLEGQSLEDFALTTAHDTWGIGQKGKDNGALIVVAAQDRKYRFEIGYGLEGVLPDSRVGSIGRDYLVPYFRKGDYSTGIYAATLAVVREIASSEKVTITGLPRLQAPARRVPPRGRGGPLGTVVSILFAIGAVMLFIRHPRLFMFLLFASMMGGGRRGGGWGGGGGFSGGGGGFGGGGASGGW